MAEKPAQNVRRGQARQRRKYNLGRQELLGTEVRAVRKVNIKQRLTKVAGLSQTWEVYGMMSDLVGIKHCRLLDVHDRTRTILISEWALLNPRFYWPIHSENPPHRWSFNVGASIPKSLLCVVLMYRADGNAVPDSLIDESLSYGGVRVDGE